LLWLFYGSNLFMALFFALSMAKIFFSENSVICPHINNRQSINVNTWPEKTIMKFEVLAITMKAERKPQKSIMTSQLSTFSFLCYSTENHNEWKLMFRQKITRNLIRNFRCKTLFGILLDYFLSFRNIKYILFVISME
jgi:hypothetical protein